jgi:hypothetical protein
MKRRNFQIFAGLALATALLTYPLYSGHFRFTVEQALGMFLGFGTFAFWYFDGLMNGVIKSVDDGLRGHVDEGSLADAMSIAHRIKKHWRKVRILGTSTGQIQPLFASSELEADAVEVIMRRVRDDEIVRDPQLAEFRTGNERMKSEWRELERLGRIRSCTIMELEFFPLDYVVIFDEQVLVAGLLLPEPGRYSQVDVSPPTTTIARTVAAKREITRHIDRFDRLKALATTCQRGD